MSQSIRWVIRRVRGRMRENFKVQFGTTGPCRGGTVTKLKAGDRAPDFELKDATGKTWRLSDLRGQKVIVYFYPADHTPGCTIEACDFRDAYESFTDAGYVILGISPQGIDSHSRFSEDYELNFPLLAAEDEAVGRRYGVMLEEPYDYKGIPITVRRSTFVVDEEGNLLSVQYGISARDHVAELRRLLDL